MDKHKNATKGGRGVQKGASPTLSSHGGEQGDTGNKAQDLMEEVASMEEVFSQMGSPSKMPFRSPSKQSLSCEHWGDHSMTPEDQMHYCVHVRVILREGIGDQPPWNGSLISDI